MRSRLWRTCLRAVRPATSPRWASQAAVFTGAGPRRPGRRRRAGRRGPAAPAADPLNRAITSCSSSTASPASAALRHPSATPSTPPAVASPDRGQQVPGEPMHPLDRSSTGEKSRHRPSTSRGRLTTRRCELPGVAGERPSSRQHGTTLGIGVRVLLHDSTMPVPTDTLSPDQPLPAKLLKQICPVDKTRLLPLSLLTATPAQPFCTVLGHGPVTSTRTRCEPPCPPV